MALDTLSSRSAARDRARSDRPLAIPPKQAGFLSNLLRRDPAEVARRRERREEFKRASKELTRDWQRRRDKIYSDTRNYKSRMERRIVLHRNKPYQYLPDDVKKVLREANIRTRKQWEEETRTAGEKLRRHFDTHRRVQLRASEKQLESDRRKLSKQLARKYSSKA